MNRKLDRLTIELKKAGAHAKIPIMIESINELLHERSLHIGLKMPYIVLFRDRHTMVKIGSLVGKEPYFLYHSKYFGETGEFAEHVFEQVFAGTYGDMMMEYPPTMFMEGHPVIPVPKFDWFTITFLFDGNVREMNFFDNRDNIVAFVSSLQPLDGKHKFFMCTNLIEA